MKKEFKRQHLNDTVNYEDMINFVLEEITILSQYNFFLELYMKILKSSRMEKATVRLKKVETAYNKTSDILKSYHDFYEIFINLLNFVAVNIDGNSLSYYNYNDLDLMILRKESSMNKMYAIKKVPVLFTDKAFFTNMSKSLIYALEVTPEKIDTMNKNDNINKQVKTELKDLYSLFIKTAKQADAKISSCITSKKCSFFIFTDEFLKFKSYNKILEYFKKAYDTPNVDVNYLK